MSGAPCRICPRACGAMREARAGGGPCRAGTEPVVARAALHFGEEPCICGTRGSGTVFFCGCPLGCVFCQNEAISTGTAAGHPLDAKGLGRVFASLVAQGAHNINLVTAGHFLPTVAQALRAFPPGVPVVYNSSGYETAQVLAQLDGLVDVYLPDFKFATPRLAQTLAGAPDYPQVALVAIAEMLRQTGPVQMEPSGLMRRGTLVRHLVLPGLTGASMRALSMLHDAFSGQILISLMGQYTPCGKARAIAGLDRPLLGREYARVQAHMQALGFSGYVQPPEASGADMIPQWDLTGVAPDPSEEATC